MGLHPNSPVRNDSVSDDIVEYRPKQWSMSPCNDGTWLNFVYKGNTLLQMMVADDVGAGALFMPPLASASSQWTNFPTDLTTWGWSPLPMPAMYCDTSNRQFGIEKALQGLGLSSSSPNLKYWYIQHGVRSGRERLDDQKYTVNGKEYRATGGDFSLLMNPTEGFLMISKQYSPAYEGPNRSPPVTELPNLQHSSDIVFGQWTSIAQGNTKNIKYIVIWSLANMQSASAVAKALSNTNSEIGNWPGASFNMDTPEGKALLGTPNGVGVGYMLAQHKAQLGKKTISKVDVFLHESTLIRASPCMVFHVKSCLISRPTR
ncbi:hypothetical protein K505DRAFT_361196 [Melanomma pulvis-pyrius CBS 109.77]|uniref:Uncharacterized protein n=1 Tax=Melanomma pulvis-pyrius CBS 109.77 TaxID=1314802 RepID=A0A6A6XEI7_9PLEO|nr:hypothetical protein K505DRAFT_361196 [Melanomma pulvis-pyrius CBS 109.77]